MAEKTNALVEITVLVAAYCSEKTLSSSIESILRQDYPYVEIILCDDGTPEFKAPECCEKRVTILHQHKNIGTVRSLNAGLRRATGKWVMCLAGDDALASETVLSELMHCAEGTKRGWILGKTQSCDKSLRQMDKIFPTQQEVALLQQGNTAYAALCRHCFIPSCGTLYRRNLLERYHAFDERFYLVEDWPLFLRLLRDNELPELCDAVTVLHRRGGISGRAAAKNQVYQRDLITVIEQEILPHLNVFSPQERRGIEQLCCDKIAIYQLRFEINSFAGKVRWICTHLNVICRRLFYRK